MTAVLTPVPVRCKSTLSNTRLVAARNRAFCRGGDRLGDEAQVLVGVELVPRKDDNVGEPFARSREIGLIIEIGTAAHAVPQREWPAARSKGFQISEHLTLERRLLNVSRGAGQPALLELCTESVGAAGNHARVDDELEVEASVGIVNRAKIRFDYGVWRGDELLLEASITCACVRLDEMRICSMDARIRAAFG